MRPPPTEVDGEVAVSLRYEISLCALVAAVSYGTPAHGANKDGQAKRLAEQAIGEDYLATRFGAAIKKLQRALKLCGNDACSPGVVARLHRDLGSVYITGQHKRGPGKKELEKALAADPSIELDPNLESPELRRTFDEVKAKNARDQAPAEPSEPAPEPATESVELDETGAAPAPAPQASSDDNSVKQNWVSASLAQDFLLYGSSGAVCPTITADGSVYSDASYRCFVGDQYYEGDVYALSGNQVSGGIGVATTRLLLGYDRLLGERILVGARVGYAFGGSPTAPDSGKFLPLHTEVRGTLYFGQAPFKSTSLRPFVTLGAGVAQVAGRVSVQVYENEAGYVAGQRFQLDAWRRAGNVFAAAGGGVELPLGSSAIRVEGRFMQLFGTSASALSIGAGYALGL